MAKQNLAGLAQIALAQAGGRAPINVVAVAVREMIPLEDYITYTHEGWKGQIRKALNADDGAGLPSALHIGDQYVQRALFGPGEYREAIAAYCRRGREMFSVARALSDECYERTGERIELAEFAEVS